jgi:hypothetical protein
VQLGSNPLVNFLRSLKTKYFLNFLFFKVLYRRERERERERKKERKKEIENVCDLI